MGSMVLVPVPAQIVWFSESGGDTRVSNSSGLTSITPVYTISGAQALLSVVTS